MKIYTISETINEKKCTIVAVTSPVFKWAYIDDSGCGWIDIIMNTTENHDIISLEISDKIDTTKYISDSEIESVIHELINSIENDIIGIGNDGEFVYASHGMCTRVYSLDNIINNLEMVDYLVSLVYKYVDDKVVDETIAVYDMCTHTVKTYDDHTKLFDSIGGSPVSYAGVNVIMDSDDEFYNDVVSHMTLLVTELSA